MADAPNYYYQMDVQFRESCIYYDVLLEALRELIYYTGEGNVVAVRLLSRAGVNVNMQDEDGWTALHYAADEAQQEVAQLLVGECGADSSIKTHEGLTPADVAGIDGNIKLQKLLLEAVPSTPDRLSSTSKQYLG